MKLEIPDRDFAGYIFDCDGTLIDSMPIHYRAWSEALKAGGAKFDFSRELFHSNAGRSVEETISQLNKMYGTSLNATEIGIDKERRFEELMGDIQPIQPVVDFAKEIAKKRPISVATGTLREMALKSLEVAGIADLFSIVITPEDVVHGKPAPDMFLLAAERMGVSPVDCLVFEDGELGIQGAESAGMKWVRVPHGDAY